ncbi:hypothetical protein Stsp01_66760 [Streptomyces sp. NBRC 13847]|uniref:DnaB-like helicase N-terminal domain-containing protein n=1 Tax=Streptomyces TaxID=1883 RepID=UPI0024A102AE|nr:DnaB-like helicase N-terminal domain-containing protein [Streptomyces sp. NBRC 13847]GLW19933.1 hypothetical protein Stsp01_66760 [Streptomyces sp. NBRC 13847]
MSEDHTETGRPHRDLDAEQAVLHAMMASDKAAAEIVEVLYPKDFYRPAHELIYTTILGLYARKENHDAAAVGNELDVQEQLDRAGGRSYLTRLANSADRTKSWAKHAERLQALATLRRTAEAAVLPFVGRTHLHHTIEVLEGPRAKAISTPWPEMDEVLNLKPGRVSCMGTRSRSREAQAGYDIALHNAACGLRTILFAPDLTPRNPVPGLTVDRSRLATVEHMQDVLAGKANRGEPAALVVVDRLQMMYTDRKERVCTIEDAEQVSKELKWLSMTRLLGNLPILLLARLERPRGQGHPLEVDDLGIAAGLGCHADTLVLADRTDPAEVNVLVAKDRSGPTPRRLTIRW